ncbi:MAG: S1 RNA-binding domain-containing protein [Chloroflexi bacterium]|nr:S1 RNA-binding domain-containing protein [Chloroflexota bacterium]
MDNTQIEPEEDFASAWEAMGQDSSIAVPSKGDIREGTIISARGDEILVDIGAKEDAVVSSYDLQHMSNEERRELQVGKKLYVYVTRSEDRDSELVVSINLARAYADWQEAEKLRESAEPVQCTVTGSNKGGLVCNWRGLQGFIPLSQISGLGSRDTSSQDALAAYMDMELTVKIIEVNRRRRRLIMSERAARRESRSHLREQLLASLQEGQLRTGTVSSLRDFGAFVDLGGIDGLVHISEISWSRIQHPSEMLSVGQQVEVLVLRLELERQRISLSIKRTTPDPWQTLGDKYRVGQEVNGVITRIVDFGVFVEIEPGIEGLVHQTELADGSFSTPQEQLPSGTPVKLIILAVAPEQHHLSLSLRSEPEAED